MAFTTYQGVWCIGQVTILALVAVVSTWIWLRRQPMAAARIASVAIAAILAVTLLAFVSFPSWVRWKSDDYRASASALATNPTAAGKDTRAADSSATTAGVGLINLCNVVSQSLRATTSDLTFHRGMGWSAVLIATTVVAGFVRFIAALVYVRRLYCHSRKLLSDDVCFIALRLAAAMGVTQRIELRECAELLSPAVVGWRRPVILFPAAWTEWNDEQLNAALAHELAHIRRSDWLTRVGGGFATALHFYHPLVHWLANQLALSQELAADRLAVDAIGERQYLRGISQLAIWLDEQSGLRAKPLVLPTLSSNLIRRITMLRTKDCVVATKLPRRGTAIVVAVLAGVTLITTALRGGAAESNGAESKNEANVSASAEEQLFDRPPLDFSIIGDNKMGAFVIRVGEILKQPELRRLVETQVLPAEKAFKQSWAQEFGPDVLPPTLELDAIDYVAGRSNLVIRPAKPGDPLNGTGDQVMAGFDQAVVHFNRPVRWKEWFQEHLPGTTEKTDGQVSYLELPVIKAMGPKPMFVAARDAQTIVFALGSETIVSAADPAPRPVSSALAARWKELDGGLITFIGTDHDVHATTPSSPDAGQALAAKVFQSARLLGLGVDVDPVSHRVDYRLQLTCDSSAAAEEMKLTFESIKKLGKAELSAAREQLEQSQSSTEPAGKDSTADAAEQRRMNRLAEELISNFKVSVWGRPEDAAGVLVESAAALPEFAPEEATVAREKGATTSK